MHAYFTLDYFEKVFGKKEMKRVRSLEKSRQRNIRNVEKGKQPIVCECGAMVTYSHLSRHRSRNKHKRALD